jgi:hypothetical protein
MLTGWFPVNYSFETQPGGSTRDPAYPGLEPSRV